ncbi:MULTISPECIES: hypothetical protein [Limimaricola]|jgi:hypothetical protein|uniref:Uncharacterized protein n=1 Tax=Limimaricola litoreus TaxID=2955316 RepID=A0A9X2FRD2_9RHOB|nr:MULTISPECIES: hypothetical protein [Limimaricola]MCP1168594.1 hypothetical protein [Limimaricola litoreus]
MTTDLEFLDNFGFDVESLEDVVRFDPIWEVWEQFGSFQDIKRSPRPGEHGVFEISDSDKNHSLSFLLPFDETGALSGPGRIALESREEEIESQELDMAVSREIWVEIEDDIRDALPQLGWESRPGNDGFCLADHRYWVQKYATVTASPESSA